MPSPARVVEIRPPSELPRDVGPSPHRGRRLFIIAASIAFVLLGLILYIHIWPFSRRSVLQNLGEASDSTVTVRGFHKMHFPVPGCVLEGVEFHHGNDHFKLAAIDKLVIRGSYIGIITHRIARIVAIGAHIYIPPFGSNTIFNTQHSNMTIEQIIANGAQIEFISKDEKKPPFIFNVHEALLTDVRWDSPIQYKLKFHIPEPPGELSVAGEFGPWSTGGDTPLSGDYSLTQLNLSVYGGVAGMLSASGRFGGTLKHIDVQGTTDTPDFEVKSGCHKIALATRFEAYVDATHGDTYLNQVDATFGHTHLVARGSVAGVKGQAGKSALLHLKVENGRIEDVLGMFVSEPHSPMSGDVSLETKAEIPSGDEPFLKKVRLDGGFTINEGKFSKPETQQDVDKLSAGARGKKKDDPPEVLTDLNGRVQTQDGLAHFLALSFGIPGAKARLHGTYSLLNHKIDLHGRMRVDTKISKTTSGFKSVLLKLLDPLFKKRKKGEVVPVHILGTYEKPQFGLDMGNEDNKKQLVAK